MGVELVSDKHPRSTGIDCYRASDVFGEVMFRTRLTDLGSNYEPASNMKAGH